MRDLKGAGPLRARQPGEERDQKPGQHEKRSVLLSLPERVDGSHARGVQDLDDREPRGFDRPIELGLLAHHRFRLDDLARAVAARDVEHVRVDLARRLGP